MWRVLLFLTLYSANSARISRHAAPEPDDTDETICSRDVKITQLVGKKTLEPIFISGSDLEDAEESGIRVMDKKMGECRWLYSVVCDAKVVRLVKSADEINGEDCKKSSYTGAKSYDLTLKKPHTSTTKGNQTFEGIGDDLLDLGDENDVTSIKFEVQRIPKTPKAPPAVTLLPPPLEALRCNGELWTAFKLSTGYSPRNTEGLGESIFTAKIEEPQMPSPKTYELFQHKVFGQLHAESVIWREVIPTTSEVETIFVAFQCATKSQLKRIVGAGSSLTVYRWEDADAYMTLGKYIGKKAEQLWTTNGLGQTLLDIAREGGQKKFIFAGLSHGAALGQVISLRFEMVRRHLLKTGACFGMIDKPCAGMEASTTYSITWNGYKVFAVDGTHMHTKLIGDRAAHLISTTITKNNTVITDAVPGIFKRPTFADMDNTFLLDQDGILHEPRSERRIYPRNVGLNLKTLNRVMALHQTWQIEPRIEKQTGEQCASTA